jgi:hypothetical protein
MLSNSYQYGLPSDNKMLNKPINYSEFAIRLRVY